MGVVSCSNDERRSNFVVQVSIRGGRGGAESEEGEEEEEEEEEENASVKASIFSAAISCNLVEVSAGASELRRT